MPRVKLCERELLTDRWSARIVSPYDIQNGVRDENGPVVILHPGWGKSPERHARFLLKLADSGFQPLGLDTRYAYSDRRQPRTGYVRQPRSVGETNPWFTESGRSGNRWQYRRPTVVLDICTRLGVIERTYIGHSDGGRILALASSVDANNTKQLILINAAGTGDSSKGIARLARSNSRRIGEIIKGEEDEPFVTIKSALGSVAYTLSHLRRFYEEKRVIQSTDTWRILDDLNVADVAVTVLHARNDEMISFADSAEAATRRPWINFVPTEGSHSNIYKDNTQELVLASLI